MLGTEDQIPGPDLGRFDHALQGAYLRMAHAAVSVGEVSFRHEASIVYPTRMAKRDRFDLQMA
jgi:hypothetical protein